MSRPLVVILTAGMGAGHDQVGNELVRRLDCHGVDAAVVDTGELLPAGWGKAMTASYRFMACRAQWLYELTYRASMCPRPGATPTVAPLSIPASRRLVALVERENPSLVLSTFHLSSQIAGRARSDGRLQVPVVSFLLDFFVHGMWANPGVDAHLLLHRSQLPQLLARGGRCPVVCGPVVRPAFSAGPSTWQRALARQSLGISPGEHCVLVVAGSWGAGAVTQTLEAIHGARGFVPVVVAGHNERLREEAAGWPHTVVLGWVDDMERLMAAADVVVENAGGLSAMEAMATGVPVVTHAPIAGHGRANAAQMHKAGVSLYARSAEELVSYLGALCSDTPLRRRLVTEATRMFYADAASVLATWARNGVVSSSLSSPSSASGLVFPERDDLQDVVGGGTKRQRKRAKVASRRRATPKQPAAHRLLASPRDAG